MKIMHSKVMTIANRLTMSGIGRTTAMLKTWALIKMPLVETQVAGVTQGRRQEALEHLTHYKASDVRVYLCRDKHNLHDSSAVAVIVSVAGSGAYCMCYLPRPLAAHSLRHTNATLLIASGTNIKTVSGRLGHASTSTTGNIYSHAIKTTDEIAAEKLDDILTPIAKRG